jgi:hypothetical protein
LGNYSSGTNNSQIDNKNGTKSYKNTGYYWKYSNPNIKTFEVAIMITETPVFQSVDVAKKAIKHLTTVQKRPVVISDHKNTTSDVQVRAAPVKSLAIKGKMGKCISVNS